MNTIFLTVFFIILGPVVVEITGYFWHRFVEHGGIFGSTIQYKHYLHHERDYPTTKLRPRESYTSARSFGWYLLTIFLVTSTYLLLPLRYSLPMILSGLIYAKFVISTFHSSFHKKGYWLNRYSWYKKLVYLHDIHHYKPVNYGINLFVLDKLFGTYSDKMPKEIEDNFPTAPKELFKLKIQKKS